MNPNPARIINMSLGGSGACPASYQDAINQILAKGVVVVASAGNETGAVSAPANCAGVIAVGGVREDGTKVGYSSFGSQVAVSAPAGNCVNTGAQQPCLYTITTTTNLGVQSPGTNDYTGQYYCYPDSTGGSAPGSYPNCSIGANQYRTNNVGTSFSAPMVAGIAALMASVNGNLSPGEISERIKASASAFPQSSHRHFTAAACLPEDQLGWPVHLHQRRPNVRRRNGERIGRRLARRCVRSPQCRCRLLRSIPGKASRCKAVAAPRRTAV